MTISILTNMKLSLLTFATITGLIFAATAADKTAGTANTTNRFAITGMHCDGCAGGLTAELKETRGVTFAQVTLSNKLAVVAFDTNKVSTAQLTKAIKTAGFEASLIKP